MKETAINPFKIRTFAAHEWQSYKNLRLRALADSPDAFGRTLAEAQERPDDYWSGRLSSGANSGRDLPLVAEWDGEPIGLAWGRIEATRPEVANLYQVWVDPNYRQRGVGQMLLTRVIAWARARNARYLDLGVTFADSPALRLYQRNGFEPTAGPEPLRPGSALLGLPMRLDLTSRSVIAESTKSTNTPGSGTTALAG
jgi:ribosomal protein S18 acetylase RimI-like enzyme